MITQEEYKTAKNIVIEYRNQIKEELKNIDILMLGFDDPIQNLDIDTRMYNCLSCNGYKTVGDVMTAPISSFKNIRNWGKASESKIIKLKNEFYTLNK